MFLCDDCHDASAHVADLFRSRGTCEDCGLTAACIDCHYPKCNARRQRQTSGRRHETTRGKTSREGDGRRKSK